MIQVSESNPDGLIYSILGETYGVLRIFEKTIHMGGKGLVRFEKTEHIRMTPSLTRDFIVPTLTVVIQK